jgi:hypothetical protein
LCYVYQRWRFFWNLCFFGNALLFHVSCELSLPHLYVATCLMIISWWHATLYF